MKRSSAVAEETYDGPEMQNISLEKLAMGITFKETHYCKLFQV